MNHHPFVNKLSKTKVPCFQCAFSVFSAPSAVPPLPFRNPKSAIRNPHLGLFRASRHSRISFHRNWLCPTPQAKKGPERPSFSQHLIFSSLPLSASSSSSAADFLSHQLFTQNRTIFLTKCSDFPILNLLHLRREGVVHVHAE